MGLLVLAWVSATGFVAAASFRQNRGYGWADSVCTKASALCASPGWLMLLAMIIVLFYLYRRTLPTE